MAETNLEKVTQTYTSTKAFFLFAGESGIDGTQIRFQHSAFPQGILRRISKRRLQHFDVSRERQFG